MYFFHVVFRCFSSCLHMCCVQLFICLFACVFGIWHCMCNHLFVLLNCSFACRKITHVCNCLMCAGCWRCHFLVLGSLRSLWIRFFCATGFDGYILGLLTLICFVVEFLLFVFDSFRACFFPLYKPVCYTNLRLLVFILFVAVAFFLPPLY